MSDLLKQVIQDLIQDRGEQAQVTIHDYFVTKTKELTGLTEAKGEYNTFQSWKAAVKKKHPEAWIEGDEDIAQAMIGPKPYKRGETKSVGEWDGAKGEIYSLMEGALNAQENAERQLASRRAQLAAVTKQIKSGSYSPEDVVELQKKATNLQRMIAKYSDALKAA